MRLKLKRPLVVLDVETTGVHPQIDRIVQIGLVKIYPKKDPTEWKTLVNPGMPIPPEATEVHGITDEDVSNAPPFKEIAEVLGSGFRDCDIGGFNAVRFDVFILKEEFRRAGFKNPFEGAKFVDGLRIYHQKEPRNLSAAVEFYLHRKMEGAHDALIDARETANVILAQLEKYPELPDNVEELHKIFFETPAEGYLDPDGKLAWRFGKATINFGKYATVPLENIKDKKYLHWIMDGEFSDSVKRIIHEALKGNFPRRD